MKKFKEFLPALILAFVASFMVFVYEPVTMYANNINDFWFDFYVLISPSLIIALIAFIAMNVVFLIVFFLSNHFKKPKIYQYFYCFTVICFIVAYIHGNFLADLLPSLDGTEINWNEFWPNFISVAVCAVVAVGIILCCKFFKVKQTIKYSMYVSIAIFAMLFVSLLTTIATTSVFEPKEIMATSSIENINTISSNKNYMILLLDAVDATHFNKIVESSTEYQEAFKDFTFFPDTLSGYAFTRDSIPFIFSGEWNENKELFSDYSTKAFDNSKLLNRLSSEEYDMNFYDTDLVWRSRKVLNLSNVVASEKNVKLTTFAKQELKYGMFKYLPHPLKRFSRIATMNFNVTRRDADNLFFWDNASFYNNTLNQPLQKKDQKYFQYVHLEGAHTPFDLNEDLEIIDDGTYPQKLAATMKTIKKYIDRLKTNEAYDSSVIIVMADHGFYYEGTERQNPILYIKGVNEKHNKMLVSDKQVSYVDMSDAMCELLDGKSSQEIFSEIPSSGRTRRFLYNWFEAEDHMIEYVQTGKAWDVSTFKQTGKTFDL